MHLTPEQREVGRDNYYEATGVSRRDFLKEIVAVGAVTGAGLGAMYFGYGKSVGDPVRVGVIGTGDEGSVLIGGISPEYVQVVAIADIRPYNIHRAFHGDYASDTALAARPGLIEKYGWASEDQARQNVKVYEHGYEELLKDPNVEAVIIALPLHLHHPAAMAAMKAGKHVLTEKLMAHDIAQCKEMARTARETKLLLATGHQRHYSVLYDNAVNLIRWGVFGELHHIRAQWHRGNLPGGDSWQQPLPGGEEIWVQMADKSWSKKHADRILSELNKFKEAMNKEQNPATYDQLQKRVAQWEAWNRDRDVKAEDYGYIDMTLPNGRQRSALEELCRWRLWERTGGGLMAELGSHQLDASSIFIAALREDRKKVHPLTVHAVGGRHTFPLDREADDHVYCTYEFPAPGYEAPPADNIKKYGYFDAASKYPDPEKGIPSYAVDPNKRIVVTYSSIMGNGFGGYGEVVMGSKGTLILEREQEVMVFKDSDTSSRISVKDDKGSAVLDTQASGPPAAALAKAADTGPVSRGYTEEIEHWAWCIRNPDPNNKPKCYPEVALGDAVIALTSKLAMQRSATKGGFVRFDPEWFDIDSPKTPEQDLA